MGHSWYYVENNDRVGPIEESELVELIQNGSLVDESYIWRKGFDNWMPLIEVEELQSCLSAGPDKPSFDSLPPQVEDDEDGEFEEQFFDWSQLGMDQQVASIKIGSDRGCAEIEYGPFSLNMLGKLYREKRINAKTLIFAPGMDNWVIFADIPMFEELTSELPPVLDDSDRRLDIRKPFVARLLFHDSSDVYEGVCRDISVGGMQILVADAPVKVHDQVSLNVHPDNREYCFVAKGQVVRVLDGNQGFSLRFLDLTVEAENAIQSYVSQ